MKYGTREGMGGRIEEKLFVCEREWEGKWERKWELEKLKVCKV